MHVESIDCACESDCFAEAEAEPGEPAERAIDQEEGRGNASESSEIASNSCTRASGVPVPVPAPVPAPVRNELGVEQPEPERPRERLRLTAGADAPAAGSEAPSANRCGAAFTAHKRSPPASSSGSAVDCLRTRVGLLNIGGTASASSAISSSRSRALSFVARRERSLRREKYSGESFGTGAGEAIAARGEGAGAVGVSAGGTAFSRRGLRAGGGGGRGRGCGCGCSCGCAVGVEAGA